ncbi:Hypothetical_protein [Hexamita inflata]|uniref:Hypothetical_protein n=1 Tax=Hexamita inflata TaxID=28002 RepID=A0AA86P8S7_9EUKA|nr:Hypothetical protein HINF_LOCUS20651 [Hexamita inflata]
MLLKIYFNTNGLEGGVRLRRYSICHVQKQPLQAASREALIAANIDQIAYEVVFELVVSQVAQCFFVLKRMRENECCGQVQSYLTSVLGTSHLERRARLAVTTTQYLPVAFVLSLREVEQSARVTQRQHAKHCVRYYTAINEAS